MTPTNENAPDAGQGIEGSKTDPREGVDPMPLSHNLPSVTAVLRENGVEESGAADVLAVQ